MLNTFNCCRAFLWLGWKVSILNFDDRFLFGLWPIRAYILDNLDFFTDTMAFHVLGKLLSLLKSRNLNEPSFLNLLLR